MTLEQKVQRKRDDRSLAVRSLLDVWRGQNERLSSLLFELSDDDLSQEISQGRNSGVYILGHLAAINDGMLPILGFGERLFPVLEDTFIREPHDAEVVQTAACEMRRVWADLIGVLRENFEKLSIDDWFDRHAAVSVEDFENEPHRNRIGVLINRTNHLSYHLGQLMQLKGKREMNAV